MKLDNYHQMFSVNLYVLKENMKVVIEHGLIVHVMKVIKDYIVIMIKI